MDNRGMVIPTGVLAVVCGHVTSGSGRLTNLGQGTRNRF